MSKNIIGLQSIPAFIPEWFLPNDLMLRDEKFKDAAGINWDRYRQLLSTDSSDARKAWAAIDKRYKRLIKSAETGDQSTKWQARVFPYSFARILTTNAIGPRGAEKFSPSERQSFIEKIEESISTLTTLLEDIGVNRPVAAVVRSFEDMKTQTYTPFARELEIIPSYYTLPVTELLAMVLIEAKVTLDPKFAIIKKPRSPDAEKLYFCRMFGGLLNSYLGTPLYAAVATFGSILLNVEMDEGYVRFALRRSSRAQINS